MSSLLTLLKIIQAYMEKLMSYLNLAMFWNVFRLVELAKASINMTIDQTID